MKLWLYLLIALVLFGTLLVGVYYAGTHPGGVASSLTDKATWQRMASPGPLSDAHNFLEHDCTACHTPVKGVEANNCIACHSNNEALLGVQTTSFHADIGSCRSCHVEHLKNDRRPIAMNHNVLAEIGRQRFGIVEPEWTENSYSLSKPLTIEALLNCANCHSNQDPHRGFFGTECAACHATTSWNISDFQHPTVKSTDCAQCHQAPPSHYMEHFKMVSMKVSGVMHAEVTQCFLCHKSSSWNDIKGIGWYKHH